MRVTLEVRTGLEIGRRFDVVPGPELVFGHSDRVFGYIPHDAYLAGNHFCVQWEGHRVHLRAMSGKFPTLLNGEPVREAVLKEGDQIRAGHTTFEVRDLVAGAVAAAPPPEEESVAGPAAGDEVAPAGEADEDPTGPELIEWLSLGDDAAEHAEPGRTAAELLPVFLERKDWTVALRLQAHVFDPRSAVWWGILCVRDVLGDETPEKESAGFAAAEAWVVDPSEENRRAAEALGPPSGMKGLACWLCTAVYWSGGSLAPAGVAEIPPDRRLTGSAVAALLAIAAPYEDPGRAPDRTSRFLALAREISDGAHPFPEPVAV